jgi:phosphoribosylformylglycinamidine (FGAM) synthase-like enzyme
MTDCGAGGFSSAVGEMGSQIGARVHLERAPLKYAGLSYTEIWISEAQERMVLAVPEKNVTRSQPSAMRSTSSSPTSALRHAKTPRSSSSITSTEVGELPMHFLHDGIPTPDAPGRVVADIASHLGGRRHRPARDRRRAYETPLAPQHRQQALDHPPVRPRGAGRTIVKPLVGPRGRGPGDASVLEPRPGTNRGIALACGLQTPVGDPDLGGDPYHMALSAVDECVRNLVCVGADPSRIAILDNFCWPSCEKPENLARARPRLLRGATTVPRPIARRSCRARTRSTTSCATTTPRPARSA